MKIERFQINISDSIGSVSAELVEPHDMRTVMTLAHGAGAGMDHRFMTAMSKALGEAGIGSVRFNFPYVEKGKKMPDPPAIAERTVSKVLEKTFELYPNTPIFSGGKSFGGRMTSQHVSKHSPHFLRGIIFYGFPLHPMGKPSIERAAHLQKVKLPMLFLQGTKDSLAVTSLIEEVTGTLPTATLHLMEGADHSFMSGKNERIPELVQRTMSWCDPLLK